MTTSPEALREAVERLQSLNLTADAALPMSFSWVRPDVETLLSALQEAREALTQISVGPLFVATDVNAWAEYATNLARETLGLDTEARALSPGGAE